MNKDQIDGATKEFVGKVQKEIGKLTKSSSQKIKGTSKEIEGKIQKEIGNGKEKVKKALDE